ncbi:MAG: PAS domain S-box protein, partial [Cyclobacteriaceae bacterium]|nr:PAS domain S-box protein [Cyclobacteriaceae bacterium]
NMLGYTREEVEGRYFMEFTADEHKERANRFYIEQYKKKIRDTYVEFKLKKKDGQKIWVGQGARIEYNERGLLKNFLLVIRDISERKKAEKKIQQQKKQLEKKNTELEESYKRLLRAKASKKTAGIILVIALFLFVFSEVMIEPLIENYFSDSWEYTGIIVKGILALSLKPLDNSLENYFLKNG